MTHVGVIALGVAFCGLQLHGCGSSFAELSNDGVEVDSPRKTEGCVCPFVFAPVCGNDGKTYGNQCELDCAAKETGVKLESDGPCPCICPAVVMPVCGSDGKTYNNECEAGCAGVTKFKEGPCPEPCPCEEIYQPVCGTDDVTYDNKCSLSCAEGTEACKGECPCEKPEEPCGCPKILEEVCGDDGNTYNNQCLAECAGASVFVKGRCEDCPSKRWNDGCNDCRLDVNKIVCADSDLLCGDVKPDKLKCTHVDCENCHSGAYYDGCNSCTCTPEGLSLCTKRFCLRHEAGYCKCGDLTDTWTRNKCRRKARKGKCAKDNVREKCERTCCDSFHHQ